MSEFSYATVDVFTVDRFGGNPLAIVPDARGLSGSQMQAIAAEFNYSETTFVLPPEDVINTARVRIFTRSRELPFAGHPNVGTGYYLGGQGAVFGKPVGSTMRFEEKAGLVEVALLDDGGVVVGASIKAPQPLKTGATMDAAIVAGCLSLAPGDIRMDRHAPTSASVGIPFFMVETDLASLSNARPDTNAFADALARHGDDNAVGRLSIFVYARKDEGVEQLRARMFSPLGGTVEDPATGSASAALGAFLMSLDPRADATAAIQIEQGVEMGRRSEIDVTVCKAQGNIDGVTVSGRCVPVMRGVIEI